MSDTTSTRNQDGEVETALLDAELFIKYQAPERAIHRLRTALERSPRSIQLRERLREISAAQHPEEAARQCLALVTLYISRENFEAAHERLLEAKHIDPRINIAPGLEAIRRARRPDLQPPAAPPPPATVSRPVTLAGDLATVSIFDAVQVIENSRLTGALAIESGERQGRVLFNDGRIVDAECDDAKGTLAFRLLVEVTSGMFDFEKAPNEFPVRIQALSNTNLILDTLRQMDEEKGEGSDK